MNQLQPGYPESRGVQPVIGFGDEVGVVQVVLGLCEEQRKAEQGVPFRGHERALIRRGSLGWGRCWYDQLCSGGSRREDVVTLKEWTGQ